MGKAFKRSGNILKITAGLQKFGIWPSSRSISDNHKFDVQSCTREKEGFEEEDVEKVEDKSTAIPLWIKTMKNARTTATGVSFDEIFPVQK